VSADPEVVVASFNLHWGLGLRRGRYPAFDVVAACAALEADVLVLQESWTPDRGEAHHEQVAAALGMQVVAAAGMARMRWREGNRPQLMARGDDPGRGGDGCWSLAVLSRRPGTLVGVTQVRQLPLDPVARRIIVADIDTGRGALRVAGTHWAHPHMGAPARTGELRRALPGPDVPAVLAGDMNMWGWCLAAVAPRGWRPAVRGPTWPSHRPHSQIDHLLTTPSVEVLDGEVLDLVASDHRPVRARVRVSEPHGARPAARPA
jgi:endonuclease/exonuclease/phosphatase family metal-dependent hydrolase